MMSGKEKIYFLLDAIDDARTLAPSGQPLLIDPTNDLNRRYREIELSQLFTKLAKDEKVLQVLKAPSRTNTALDEFDPYEHADDGCWHIELLPAFDKYYLKIQQEPEYQEFTGKKPPTQTKIEPDRKALEKIWNLLQEIETKRNITPEGSDIAIPLVDLANTPVNQIDKTSDERRNMLSRLKDEGAIKDFRLPDQIHEYVYLQIGDKYFEVYNYYKEEYKKVAQNYQQSLEEEKTETKGIAYEVKYSEKSREILVNNFLIAKPDFNSENEVVFSYLYRNANRLVKTEELEKQVGNKLKKTIHGIIRDLGFAGRFAKVFFNNASKNGVVFRNPATYQDLKDLGVERIKIQEKK